MNLFKVLLINHYNMLSVTQRYNFNLITVSELIFPILGKMEKKLIKK